ncbi:MAG: hypothetical protein O3A78_06705 [Nitrospinae bacterium]|jgi:hypothetical protein|nr:hypothetical protein [Nitrospinota bacterium]MDA1109492.1 hypothetical protein [Nitrospinota bacterium]
MEVSGLSNVATAPRPSAAQTTKAEGENSQQAGTSTESQSSVSNESQASLVPPPSPTTESGNEPTNIPSAESNTGGQINISV